MTWAPRVRERSEIPDSELDYYDGIYARIDAPEHISGPGASHYAHLLAAPGMVYHLRSIGTLARSAGERGDSFTHAQREWVDQVLAVELESDILQVRHLPDAV